MFGSLLLWLFLRGKIVITFLFKIGVLTCILIYQDVANWSSRGIRFDVQTGVGH